MFLTGCQSFAPVSHHQGSDNGFVDIAADRFDPGVRLDEAVAQDMIAVHISPDVHL